MESLIVIIIVGYLLSGLFGWVALGTLHYLVDVWHLPLWLICVGSLALVWLTGVIIRAIWGKDATK